VHAPPSGIAAGHPATAEAGAGILRAGGNAADAAVAACLASCVAETVMTGLLGGGHAIYWDAAEGDAWLLDFFVAVPGLGAVRAEPELLRLQVPFGAELVHYAVGPASCGVPGVLAGLDALWRRFGGMPWPELVAPARRLAVVGVELPPAHAACLAMLEPVMTMNEGSAIYAPGGRLLGPGDRLRQPGLEQALDLVAAEGGTGSYAGAIGRRLLALCDERGGRLTADDLASYRAIWSRPKPSGYLDWDVAARDGLASVPDALARLPRLRSVGERERVLALVEALVPDASPLEAHTTNTVVVDRDGNACVLTTSLGLGSGDFVPGLDLHLNSMLGEADLLVEPLEPGARMPSMMAPLLAFDATGSLILAAGAAGGTRLRTALAGVVAGILDEGLAPQVAVSRPRFHPAGAVVNAEPGVDEDGLGELERRRWTVRRWQGQHHYFGGVSAIGSAGGAADPRRSGAAIDV
jgi:gamma-glutamyltranspeptidase/glutathione hydrolase